MQKKNNYHYFRRRDFDKLSKKLKSSKVISTFGSWGNALESIGIKNSPKRKERKDKINEQDLFLELKRVWEQLGHRPSKTEWDSIDSKYSYTTYKIRFGGWINACNHVKNILNKNIELKNTFKENPLDLENNNVRRKIPSKEKRIIPLKLRLQVLKRDKFKCSFCGRSPATNASVELHIDHIKPFSKSGKTEINNLQTLCKDCNLGKGNSKN